MGRQETQGGSSAILDKQRRPRRDAGQLRPQERDTRLLRWVAEQYAIRQDQIGRLADTTEHGSEWIWRRWRKADWVHSERLIPTETNWVWLDKAGSELIDFPAPLWTPRPAGLRQIYLLNNIRLQLEIDNPEGVWTSERMLRLADPNSRGLPDGVWQARAGGPTNAHKLMLIDQGAVRIGEQIESLLQRYNAVTVHAYDAIWVAVMRISRLRHWDRVDVELLSE